MPPLQIFIVLHRPHVLTCSLFSASQQTCIKEDHMPRMPGIFSQRTKGCKDYTNKFSLSSIRYVPDDRFFSMDSYFGSCAKAFFTKMDKFELTDEAVDHVHHSPGDHDPAQDRHKDANLQACLTTFSTRQPSHTLVLEAAMHVIHKWFCDVRPSTLINVKWALTLLQVAVWIQVKLSKKWVTEGRLESSPAMNCTTNSQL